MNTESGDCEYAWVVDQEPLPDVCCSCGMYTDQRLVIKQKLVLRQDPNANVSFFVVLGVIVSFFLGPLGWLLSIFFNSSGEVDEEGKVLVKKKVRFPLPRCQLCAGGEELRLLDYQSQPIQFLIEVHPRFKARLEELRRSNADANRS